MNCAHPYLMGVTPEGEPARMFPCGKCLPCRVNRRRKWTARMLMEKQAHLWTSFVTLTVDDDHLDYVLGWDAVPVWTVHPDTLQRAVKRVRRHCVDKLRFVGVGEYGNRTGRPHYHLLVYGPHPDDVDQACQKAWTDGHVQVKACTEVGQIAYVAGYTVKKMNNPHDERLDGNHPEFMRSSLKPAIGAGYVERLEALLYTYGGAKDLAETGDVPTQIRLGGKKWPLDRWTRDQLRERVGIPTGEEKIQTVAQPCIGLPAPGLKDRLKAVSTHKRMERRRSKGQVM